MQNYKLFFILGLACLSGTNGHAGLEQLIPEYVDQLTYDLAQEVAKINETYTDHDKERRATRQKFFEDTTQKLNKEFEEDGITISQKELEHAVGKRLRKDIYKDEEAFNAEREDIALNNFLYNLHKKNEKSLQENDGEEVAKARIRAEEAEQERTPYFLEEKENERRDPLVSDNLKRDRYNRIKATRAGYTQDIQNRLAHKIQEMAQEIHAIDLSLNNNSDKERTARLIEMAKQHSFYNDVDAYQAFKTLINEALETIKKA